MNNKYYLIRQEEINPNDLTVDNGGREIVSFNRTVLDKYFNDNEAFTFENDAEEDPVKLRSIHGEWSLQIDLDNNHVNVWLYQLGHLPDNEQEHFAKFNIHPCPLSDKADRRWNKGLP
ncbi:MAG: hypothetical protein JO149_06060 [Gammaproteobacteria bacterium]|nr:hypothetical protein [Gammaproteobacteria bacterium]